MGKTEDGNNYVSDNGLRNGNRSDRQFWVLSVEERGILVCLPLPSSGQRDADKSAIFITCDGNSVGMAAKSTEGV